MIRSLAHILTTVFVFLGSSISVAQDQSCDASEVFFEFNETFREGHEASPCLYKTPTKLLFVNGQGIDFYEAGSTYTYCGLDHFEKLKIKPRFSTHQGCMPKHILKLSGQNQVVLSFCFADSSGNCSVTDINASYTIKVKGEGDASPRILMAAEVHQKTDRISIECTTGGTKSANSCIGSFSLEDFIPKTAAEIRILRDELKSLLEAKNSDAVFKQTESDYDKARRAVEQKSFENLTEADLLDFARAKALYLSTKQSLDEKARTFKATIDAIVNRIGEIRGQILQELSKIGADLSNESNFASLITFEPPVVTSPTGSVSSIPDNEDTVFQILADAAIESLRNAWERRDRRQFLETVYSWTNRNEQLLTAYKTRFETNPAELESYTKETRRVEEFIFGGTGSGRGYISRNFWFHDSPIPSDLIQSLEETLANDPNDRYAKRLKQILSRFGETLSPDEESIVALAYMLHEMAKSWQRVHQEALANGYIPGPSSNPDHIELNVMHSAMVDLKSAMLETAEMSVTTLNSLNPAAPLIMICEIMTGQRHCDNTRVPDMSRGDKVANVFGMAAPYVFSKVLAGIRAGAALLKGKPIISAEFQEAARVADAVLDSAKNWKIDGDGLKGIKELPSEAANDVLNKFRQGTNAVIEFIGPAGKFVRNSANDVVVLSKDGTRRVRFDLNRPYPHNNPHTHVEELINGKWEKSGPIYPTDVPAN